MPAVYVVEAQALFAPEVARLAEEAGARLVGVSSLLDLDAMIAARPDVVLLDLDFTSYDIVDVLDALRVELPTARVVLLTADHAPGWLGLCRTAGATSVLSKSSTETELLHDLRVVFEGGAIFDRRIEAG